MALLPQLFGLVYSNSRVSGQILLLLCFIEIPVFNANSVDPGHTPHSAVSDQGLHFQLPFLGVSRQKMG